MITIDEIKDSIAQPDFFSFNSGQVQVSANQIERVLGYKNSDIPEIVKLTIDEALSIYHSLIAPQGGFVIYPLGKDSLKKTSISLGSVEFNTGPIISSYLQNSSHAALFICTIGKDLETLSRKLLNESDYLKGYILDTIASEAVEIVCDLLEARLSEVVKKIDYHITNRYSPGYCNWHVSEQQRLFSLLPDNPCGIVLTESSLMLPVKSVSGIIGLGSKAKRSEYNCSFCGIENCYKKKEHA